MIRRIFLAAALAAAVFPAACGAEEYLLGPGDVLGIKVMDHLDMNGAYTVSPDGDIAFPLIGRVAVKDKSASQVQTDLTQKLGAGYLRRPVVTVSLDKAVSRKYFVYGQVKSPGEYHLPEGGITVLRAVSSAGGMADKASESKIRLLRPRAAGEAYEVIRVDLSEVLDGKTPDPSVRDQDILIVRESWF